MYRRMRKFCLCIRNGYFKICRSLFWYLRMTDDEKLIIAKAEDIQSLCEKYSEARFSVFLTENEVALIKNRVGCGNGTDTVFFGGYDESERVMMGVFPEWDTEREFPITLLKITKGYDKTLSHRDYLGSILSQGLERNRIGDILVFDGGAYVFVSADVADYILLNVKKIANCGVKITKTDAKSEKLPQREFKTTSAVAASDRLDALLAAALNLSRKDAAALVKSGKVCVNHKETENCSANIKERDLISARGYGRIILERKGNYTGSGRLHVDFKKYK